MSSNLRAGTLFLLALACCRSNEPTRAEADAGVPEAAAKPPARVARSDGAVSGPAMPAGWEWREDRRAGDGFELRELKWRHTMSNIVLEAKDYSLTTPETLTSLTARDWKAYYRSLFAEVRSVSTRPATFAGRPALDVKAEGFDSSLRAVVVQERYIPVERHLFIATSVGIVEELRTRTDEIEKWRDGVDFAALH